MNIKQAIRESIITMVEESKNKVTIYHGDNFGLTSVTGNYKLMATENSNQEEGPGIYWSNTLSVAKMYGSKIVSTVVDQSDFMASRESIGDYLSAKTIQKILMDIAKEDDEYWYILTDFIYVEEAEDVDDEHWLDLAEILLREQCRNFLYLISSKTEIDIFVKAFTKHCKYWGVFQDFGNGKTHYTTLKLDAEITPVNF